MEKFLLVFWCLICGALAMDAAECGKDNGARVSVNDDDTRVSPSDNGTREAADASGGSMNRGTETLFLVQEISKEEFDAAENSPQRYVYTFLCDSVVENEITRKILADVRARMDRFDFDDQVKYDISEEEYDSVCTLKNLRYAERLGIYGFNLGYLLCYNAQTGKYMGKILRPQAISPKGIMVSQEYDDCDVVLNLHFYHYWQNYVIDAYGYRNTNYYAGSLSDYFSAKEWGGEATMFFVGDNQLYISLYRFVYEVKHAYLKITLPDPESTMADWFQ